MGDIKSNIRVITLTRCYKIITISITFGSVGKGRSFSSATKIYAKCEGRVYNDEIL